MFDEKLSRLADTIALAADWDASGLVKAMSLGEGRLAVAIGSGGSAVTAHYFARCRTTLGHGPTLIMTPMEFVLSMDEWNGADIWLFSAGAANPDIAAAFKAAIASRCRSVLLMTVRADGATAQAAASHPRGALFALPVADPKDGFLATHSMMAMITGLLLASDQLTEWPQGKKLVEALCTRSSDLLASSEADAVADFCPGDTIIVLHDPQVSPVAVLLETSLWETGIAPVQRTDFRNFAHGRHVWAARHPESMFALAMTTRESEAVWHPIMDAMPGGVRRGGLDLGHGGRLANAVGVVEGLIAVRSLGRAAAIDPGRPGRGPFAEAIYEDPALQLLAGRFTNAVRHKAAASLLHDSTDEGGISICAIGKQRLIELEEADFVGIVLDYDGTVVPNEPAEARLGPPSKEVMDELVRLVDDGVQVGFATGRGKSAGIKLREALPEWTHRLILMGYYNGAHIRSLDVDICDDPPEGDDAIAAVSRWIAKAGLVREGADLGNERVQVSVNQNDVFDVARFAGEIASCPEVADGRVVVRRSQHSFDIFSCETSKRRVVEAVAARAGRADGFVLGIGDSGSPLGNDHELLSGPHGLSVDTVCGSHQGAWTLFGTRLQGPDAVARILRAARVRDGSMSIDIGALGLDG